MGYLSDRLGPLAYSEDDGEIFLGRSVTKHKHMSDVTAHAIDEEIRALVDTEYQRAENILKENTDKLHIMADALIRYETIDERQIKDIMEGRDPRPPADWDTDGTAPAEAGPSSATKGKDTDAPIGGPASQH